jgi:hypothetical protein
MSSQFYVGEPDRPEWIITVDDPGYGYLHIDHASDDAEWSQALWGTRLGRFTAHVTQLALLQDADGWMPVSALGRGWTLGLVGMSDPHQVARAAGCSYEVARDAVGDAAATPLPPFLTVRHARRLLPVLTRATLLAAAATDRYDRLYPDPDDAPAAPLCVRCGLGSPYTGEVSLNMWCEEHGHRPFGEPSGTTWEAATARYAQRTGTPVHRPGPEQ